jgi:hypothetical protein
LKHHSRRQSLTHLHHSLPLRPFQRPADLALPLVTNYRRRERTDAANRQFQPALNRLADTDNRTSPEWPSRPQPEQQIKFFS